MTDTLNILGAACAAIVFIETGIPHRVRARLGRKRIKPFDCEMCMAFWIGIGSAIFLGKNWGEAIYIGCIASVCAIIINKLLNNEFHS